VEDLQKLKAAIDSKGLRIVTLDLPTSHQGMQDTKGDEFTGRMLGAPSQPDPLRDTGSTSRGERPGNPGSQRCVIRAGQREKTGAMVRRDTQLEPYRDGVSKP